MSLRYNPEKGVMLNSPVLGRALGNQRSTPATTPIYLVGPASPERWSHVMVLSSPQSNVSLL